MMFMTRKQIIEILQNNKVKDLDKLLNRLRLEQQLEDITTEYSKLIIYLDTPDSEKQRILSRRIEINKLIPQLNEQLEQMVFIDECASCAYFDNGFCGLECED